LAAFLIAAPSRAEQIVDEQHADHVVEVVVDHRE